MDSRKTQTSWNCSPCAANKSSAADLNKAEELPEEIDDHFIKYGKRAWEIRYGDDCPMCNRPIDEFGLCACGSVQ